MFSLLKKKRKPELVLFFSKGESLISWERKGILQREIALYKKYIEAGWRVSLITYSTHDHRLQKILKGFTICCNRQKLPPEEYINEIPNIHQRILRRASVYKTNQVSSGPTALRCATIFQKPLIARCGYLLSEFDRLRLGEESFAYKETLKNETKLFKNANRIVVTSSRDAHSINERLPDQEGKPHIIPNFVDTQIFKPRCSIPKKWDVCYVGRIENQKNLPVLLRACRELDFSLCLIGKGELKNSLKSKYPEFTWIDGVSNIELPLYLTQSSIFALISHYEGHPKVLIEAMACGVPCIGTDVPGIREVISHQENGWLCSTRPADVKQSLKQLLSNTSHMQKIGKAARKHTLKKYDLEVIARQDITLATDQINCTLPSFS